MSHLLVEHMQQGCPFTLGPYPYLARSERPVSASCSHRAHRHPAAGGPYPYLARSEWQLFTPCTPPPCTRRLPDSLRPPHSSCVPHGRLGAHGSCRRLVLGVQCVHLALRPLRLTACEHGQQRVWVDLRTLSWVGPFMCVHLIKSRAGS